jgi:hypothetical protein
VSIEHGNKDDNTKRIEVNQCDSAVEVLVRAGGIIGGWNDGSINSLYLNVLGRLIESSSRSRHVC